MSAAAVLGSVLVVDDDEDLREGLGDLLAGEGYVVRTAADGSDALEDFKKSGVPDVVLLDLRMPRMDGFEFLRRQAADETIRDVPVVVVSSTTVSGVWAYPVVAVLDKPADLVRLFDVVRREVEKRHLS